MKLYEFILKFTLPDANQDAANYIEDLALAGCDDALIGIGQPGRIALQFNREATSAFAAITSAIKDVKTAIPAAELIEATPDLVGLSDIADLLGFSRQNMRKIMLNHNQSFPAPLHSGSSSIWHLAKVLNWFSQQQNKAVAPEITEVAQVTMQVNIARALSELQPNTRQEFMKIQEELAQYR
ncbi:DNA-binding protein [Rheinheimera baltica]|uniref:DNA-binding protein n=1 Tax=Rheinheimera baltica TaxID=67576 RepID=A0ABT9I507_9GAMM|nr:DNA-binding protein [Rheinheimera baltica]MDP5138487.1 DNA-binding protein [Rheinheimera baltica]MDP5150444.1 DNA-binding protein [Rheinheimera baltica]